ncbi:MAG: tetratricopeptide repeat protein, partial [Gemmatimonadaceae bacterium]
ADEPQNGRGAERSMSTQSGTLSFGGVEAQLRRRLEIDPNNWALRRLLGEELIGLGQRESGLAELEMAMSGFEQLGDLDGARDVADSVLRAVPTSVRHHQKRVEYAVRSGNRTHLVDAYVELADALFRSGDAPKAKVVYSRVLELSPSNQRARIALGLVTPADETASRAPEKYGQTSIAPGTMTGLFASAAPSPNAGGSVTDDMPSIADVTIPRSASTGGDFQSSEVSPSKASSNATPSAANENVTDGNRATPARQPRPVDATTQRPAPPAAPPAFVPAASSNKADSESTEESFVDLGEWLRATEPVRSTRMVTRDVTPSGDEQADFDDMLRRFKQGIAENVDEEDFASHYDLGVAYKEMGLIDEAISEFQKALRGDDHRERSYEALGQCFVEKGQMQVAITLLRRAVESTGSDDQQLVGVLYLLGFANEAMERHRDALGYYQRVFAVDIEFRDVAKRVAAMEHRTK